MNAELANDAAQRIARIAAAHAHAVDRDARFPAEAIDALREERLLSALVPTGFGGAGLTLGDVASICETLARGCASAAMIYAMHQSQAACVIAHCGDSAWQRTFLERMASGQWLLASATSEETTGGSLRTSTCAVEHDGERIRVEKVAPTISYGAHADAVLVTARRAGDAPSSDQVLVVAQRDQITLEPLSHWDSLGMRGTCSAGFRLVANADAAQILPAAFGHIANRTMQPVSHGLWSAVWTGLADDALQRANAHFRAQSLAKPNVASPAATRLSRATGLLQQMKARVAAALDAAHAVHTGEFEAGESELPLPVQLALTADMNTLKTGISSTALLVVHEAMMICGLSGYRNDNQYSLGRHLRDLYSAPLMINNDRIDQNTANLLLMQRPAGSSKA